MPLHGKILKKGTEDVAGKKSRVVKKLQIVYFIESRGLNSKVCKNHLII
jgi:hypothetical protein